MRLIDADALLEQMQPVSGFEVNSYAEAAAMAIANAYIKLVEKQPTVQPDTNCSEIPNNWIPCSERLPDTNRDVLLQFSTNMGVGFWENGEWGVNTGDNIYSEIGEGEAQPIAWCELPEQYQGGGKQKRGEQE